MESSRFSESASVVDPRQVQGRGSLCLEMPDARFRMTPAVTALVRRSAP